MTQTPPPVALITGAARRIGAALSRSLHAKGYTILAHYQQSHIEATALADELNALREHSVILFRADLSQLDELRAMTDLIKKQFEGLDVLINNASSFYPTPLENATEKHWDDLIGSNVKAPFFLAQQLLPALRTRRGCVINISDIFAQRPMPNHSIYSIAKAANNMLTQALALELAPKVRVNGIAPGAILWPENTDGEEVVNLAKLASIPMGQLGGTESITATALFLIAQTTYITGQIVAVDGGRSLQQ